MVWAECWYNTLYNLATLKTSFEANYGRHDLCLMNYEVSTTKNNKVEKDLIARDEVLSKFKAKMKKAQERMKRHFDEGI